MFYTHTGSSVMNNELNFPLLVEPLGIISLSVPVIRIFPTVALFILYLPVCAFPDGNVTVHHGK